MAENGSVAAPTPSAPAQGPAQPTQAPSIPAGYQLVSDADLQTYRRHGEQVSGFRPFQERLAKAGIKSEKDFESFEPIITTARQRKIDAKAFSSMFSDEADADLKEQGAPAQSIDIEQLKKEMREEATLAAYDVPYTEARKGEDKFIDSYLTKLIGDEPANEFQKTLLRESLENYLWKNRGVFPKDHPLKGRVQTFTDELGASAIKHFSELKAKASAESKGSEMADRATAANTPRKVGTPAGGGSSPSGKPSTNNQSPMDARRSKAEQVLAGINARRAAANSS